MKTLVLGYGNALRSDDGVGPFVARTLERCHIPGTAVRTLQQLHLELVEEIRLFDRVIAIDASPDVRDFEFRQLEPMGKRDGGSSHFLTAEVLQDLTARLYGVDPLFFLCTVHAGCFDLGRSFSAASRRSAKNATRFLFDKLRRESLHARREFHETYS